jgi:hypothetical protein
MFRAPISHLYSRASKIYDASNSGPLYVKWQGLDSTLLLNPVLNPVMADCGVWSADCHNKNGRPADCQSPKSSYESGLPWVRTVRRVRIRPESGGCQSAVHLRAESWLPSSYSCCGKPWNWSAVVSNIVESRLRHFTSRDPLFETSYIFEARPYNFKTNTRSVV